MTIPLQYDLLKWVMISSPTVAGLGILNTLNYESKMIRSPTVAGFGVADSIVKHKRNAI